MPTSYTLSGLTEREAVADALHRCVLGIDSNNQDLFASACLQDDNMMVVGAGFKIEGWTAINGFFARLFSLVTTHTITNIRIEVQEGAKTASMTAHAISYHIRPEEALNPEDTSYTASSLYDIDLVKDKTDGLWKIQKWGIELLWTTGDRAVLHP